MLCQNNKGRTWIDYANSSGQFDGTNWSRTDTGNPGVDKSWCSIGETYSLYIGDFNADNRDDLLCHSKEGKSWIDYADSSGTFQGTNWSRQSAGAGTDQNWCYVSSSQSLIVDDFSNDGRADLLCQNSSTGKIWVDMADSKGEFHGTNSVYDKGFCSGNSVRLLSEDVDGDERKELICIDEKNGELNMLYYRNSGGFVDDLKL